MAPYLGDRVVNAVGNNPETFKLSPFVRQFDVAVTRLKKRVIIVVDGFGHVRPDESAYKLFEKITGKLHFRSGERHLVLLCFDESNEAVGRNLGSTLQSLPPLSDFSEKDIIDSFCQFHEFVLPQISLGYAWDEDKIAESVQKVLETAGIDASPNVENVAEAVREECERLLP